MKHLKTLLFASLLFVGATSFSNAQTKIAHINTTLLVEAMPQMKTAQAEIEKLTKTYETEIKTMATELQNKMKQYQDLQKKEADLLKPIFEKAKAAISKVAKAQGFTYVLDSTQGSGVLVADGKDLLADVKKELGF